MDKTKEGERRSLHSIETGDIDRIQIVLGSMLPFSKRRFLGFFDSGVEAYRYDL
jgi:hypothetical protein